MSSSYYSQPQSDRADPYQKEGFFNLDIAKLMTRSLLPEAQLPSLEDSGWLIRQPAIQPRNLSPGI